MNLLKKGKREEFTQRAQREKGSKGRIMSREKQKTENRNVERE